MARQLLGSIEGGISDVVPSGNKKHARPNLIKHLREQALCRRVPCEKVKLPKRQLKGDYEDANDLCKPRDATVRVVSLWLGGDHDTASR